jgi:DNA excision repair protein ERCC-2
MVKNIKISVGDFALPVPRRGSIEAHSGFGRASALGQEIHQRIQAARAKDHENYQAEVPITCEFERGGFLFEVSGRVDGFFGEVEPRIEEIKSTFSLKELSRKLRETPDHPYCLQLKTYGYFHWLKTKQKPQLSFHLVSTRNWEAEDMALRLDIADYETWLSLRLDELVEEAIAAEKSAKRRRKSAEAFVFPFPKPRSGQIELIATVEEGMKEKKRMLIQAPTGLGKTVGVMFPVLREALDRGQRLIYVTPKNSQHSVAEEAVAKLQEQGAKIKAMTLTAKSKICFKNEPLCNPDYCEYAKDHYTKVAEHKVLEELAKKKKLNAKIFKEVAEKHQVCPFELQLDSAKEMDAVICDYNYVFAPRAAFGRLAAPALGQEGKPNLVIDEAHNLPSRAMGYHSPELSVQALRRIADDLDTIPKKFQLEARELVDLSVAAIQGCEPDDCKSTVKIDPPADVFLDQDTLLRAFLARYLESDVDIQPRDPVLRLCFYWSEFTAALEFVEEGKREEFFTTYNPQGAVKITCCDASEMLKDCYDEYDQVVGFSATLKPFDFYSQLSGLEGTDLKTAEFQSPFPRGQRKLLIIPQISSKYSERVRNYPRIAETISKISALMPGNYLAFFPSFDFLEKVLQEFQIPVGFNIRRQERYMKQADTELLLDELRSESGSLILFAVQGGVFSEGVDYPGKMVIGAFVVGPPLPNFDLEREEMRAYYEKNYNAGFDYAYTYPAMAKAVQSAGRVIRSETDKGIVVLMDNRFLQQSYTKSMPKDWFDIDAKELVSTGILKEVSEFWSSPGPASGLASDGPTDGPGLF